MTKNKPTIDEHYIPQFYLKQFSSDGEKIYQYDILSPNSSSVKVPTKSICYEKNLYEFKNDSGEIIHRNLIEKHLGTFETEFANVFRSIISKSKIEKNYQTCSFLDMKEKALLVFFMTTLIIRNPEILNIAKDTALEFFGNQLSEVNARNFALNTCLPIYKDLDPNERNLLLSFMKPFEKMSYQIAVTGKEKIWTSDNPVILHGKNQPIKLDEVILSINPNLVLYMKPYEKTKRGCYNRLTKMNTQDIDFINGNIVMNSKRWIYTYTPLTDKQKKWIAKIRK